MKILICQMKPLVGHLTFNRDQIISLYNKAHESGCDICLLPELCVSGYMAEDLFLYPNFIAELTNITEQLVAITKNTHLILPTTIYENDKLYNGVIVARKGKIVGKSIKEHLPNYSIFDEKRYFTGGESKLIEIKGLKIGIPICADIWHEDVCMKLKQCGAGLFLVPNASPYHKSKMRERINAVKARFNDTKIPIIYCNQVIGQDGIVFDGRSFCYDGGDDIKIVCKEFEEDTTIVEFKENKILAPITYPISSTDSTIFQAIRLGTKDYTESNGFKKVILGLSGGIDSAVVAAMAVESVGANNVVAYLLPSIYTSKDSVEDARNLSFNLGIELATYELHNIFQSFPDSLDNAPIAGSLAYQNLQARVRGTLLMAEANRTGALLLTTGNKSEYATGYATIYGDMNGGFNPIKDLYKTEVYSLAKYINRNNNIIPPRIIAKPPSAELCYNQKDSDSLPEYEILDKILFDHIENKKSLPELKAIYPPNIVTKVLKLVKLSEFKRNQAAPGVRISTMNFGKDRRFPITHFYHR